MKSDIRVNSIFILGFDHKIIPTRLRGEIAISEQVKNEIYCECGKQKIKNLLILNTCNRVQFIGVGQKEALEKIFFKIVPNAQKYASYCRVLEGVDALKYLYSTASGIISKVIGDFDILNQFKIACKEAKEYGLLGGYFERLLNSCVQTTKEIRSSTSISTGSISPAYAVIKKLKNLKINEEQTILVIGLGQMGQNVAKNIREYFPRNELFISTRDREKTYNMSEKLSCKSVEFSAFQHAAIEADVVIASLANQKKPFITSDNIGFGSKTLIDLSVPISVDPELGKKNTLIDIDQISDYINSSINERKKDIPLAEKIIDSNIKKFIEWSNFYAEKQKIHAWKDAIETMVPKCLSLKSKLEQERIKKREMNEFVVALKKNSLQNHIVFESGFIESAICQSISQKYGCNRSLSCFLNR